MTSAFFLTKAEKAELDALDRVVAFREHDIFIVISVNDDFLVMRYIDVDCLVVEDELVKLGVVEGTHCGIDTEVSQ